MLGEQLRMVAEYRDRRRRHFDLRGVHQLDLTPRRLRRLTARDERLERGVDLRRRDTLRPLGVDLQDLIERARHALPCLRRREEERHEGEKWHALARFLLELRGRLVV